MFDSGVQAQELATEIRGEVDTAPDIALKTYLQWVDEVEQLLYSEAIKEITVHNAASGASSPYPLSSITAAGAGPVRFMDIYAVYAGKTQLLYVTPVGGRTFPDTYWQEGNALCFSARSMPAALTVHYHIRPALKATGNPQDTIKLPVEWLPLVRAKLRCEAFKMVNEDAVAAKWAAEQNALMAHIMAFMAAAKPQHGV